MDDNKNTGSYPNEGTLAYIRSLGEYLPLPAKRERELGIIIQRMKGGKARLEARNELIKHNLKLVVKEAFAFSRKNYTISVSEFIGAGNEGIIKASEKFDPVKHGTKFSTYASYWIKQAMNRLVYKNTYPVSVPEYISNGLARKSRAETKNRAKNGDKIMTTKELAQALDVDEKRIKKLEKAKIKHFSLDHAGETSTDDGEEKLGDMIADEKAVDPRKGVSDQDDYERLYRAMESLDPKSQEIIKARFLGADIVRLKQLGKKFGVSHERIRQISEKALETLRKKLEKNSKL